MTKVNLTVTKDLESVPSEVPKQLRETTEVLRGMVSSMEVLTLTIDMGFDFTNVTEGILSVAETLEPLNDALQDLYNISNSYSTIKKGEKD